MRRLLLAAAGLLALAATFLAWRIQRIGSSGATPGRAVAGGPEARPPANLAPQARPSTDRGRRQKATGARSATAPEPLRDAPSGIRVLLLDSEDVPMPGVVLDVRWLREESDFDLRGTTDRAGMLATDIPDPLRIEGIAFEEDFGGLTLYAYGPFEAAPDRPQVVVVKIPRPAKVAGIVRDEEGRPVPGALVEVEPQPVLGLDPFVASLQPMKCETESGADGSFALVMPEGCVALTASAEGFDAGENAFACLSADAPTAADLSLEGAGREIRVEVRAAGAPFGQPVLVTASRAADTPVAPRASERVVRNPLPVDRTGVSLGSSVYSVGISRDGDWTLVVSLAQGFADARVPVTAGDERIVVDLRPLSPDPRFLRVHGTVSTDGGTPLSAEIAVLGGTDFDSGTIGRSDDAGHFEFEVDSRDAEPVFLLAREPGYGSQGVGPIELAQLPASIDLVLRAERTISGIVLGPDGLALAARVSIRPSRRLFAPWSPASAEPPKGFFETTSLLLGFEVEERGEAAEPGSFSFRGLSEGSYEIWASAEDRSLGLPPGCAVAEAGARDLRVVLGSGLERFVSLEGVVREAGTGRPIPGARVAAGLARGGLWGSGDSLSAEDGRYALRGCPSEVLSLYVDAEDHALFESEIGPLAPGRHDLDVKLYPDRTLRLLVLDSSGAPLPGIFVSAVDARGRPIALRDAAGRGEDDLALTDLAGRADLHGLPAAEIAAIVGRREDGGRIVRNAAYQAPNDSQPDPRKVRFDLRVAVEGVQRIVLPR